MHVLGSPSYRIEDTMSVCSRALGLEGSFFSTPTAIFAALGVPGSEPKASLLRVSPGAQELGRLTELYEIRDAVVSGQATPTVGLERVREVMKRPASRGWADPVAHGLASAGAAVLFGGAQLEVLFAGAVGLVVGLLGTAARQWPRLTDVQAPFAGAIAAFLVHIAASGANIDPTITTLAAIVALLPGFAFTTALAELAMQHLASGSARLFGVLALLLTMVVGVRIGDHCAELLVGPATETSPGLLAPGWHLLAILVTWVAYTILLRASRSQVPWILGAVALGYGGARLGGVMLGPQFGAFIGAMLVTFAANLFARWRRRPAAIVRTPGLLLLVPGSLGFRGLSTVIGPDAAAPTEGITLLMNMLVVGGSIVAGLLTAGVLLPPPLDVEPESRDHPGGL